MDDKRQMGSISPDLGGKDTVHVNGEGGVSCHRDDTHVNVKQKTTKAMSKRRPK